MRKMGEKKKREKMGIGQKNQKSHFFQKKKMVVLKKKKKNGQKMGTLKKMSHNVKTVSRSRLEHNK